MPQHILISTSEPNQTPKYIGQEYFDLNTKKFYKAAGTNQSDWQLLGSGSSTGSTNSFFSSTHVIDNIEGPGTVELSITNPIYTVNMGGPGIKIINLPSALELNKKHSFILFGQNTQGSAITVQIGDGTNVKWDGGSGPTFSTGDVIVEILLFTLDGGNQWYGKVLGSY